MNVQQLSLPLPVRRRSRGWLELERLRQRLKEELEREKAAAENRGSSPASTSPAGSGRPFIR